MMGKDIPMRRVGTIITARLLAKRIPSHFQGRSALGASPARLSKTGLSPLRMGMATTAESPSSTWRSPSQPTSRLRRSMKRPATRLPRAMPSRNAVRMVVKAWVELSRKKTSARVQSTSRARAHSPDTPAASRTSRATPRE